MEHKTFHSVFILLVFSLFSCIYGIKHCTDDCLIEATNTIMEKVMPEKIKALSETYKDAEILQETLVPVGFSPCTNGLSNNTYSCKGLDLIGFLPYSSMRGPGSSATKGNDIWGWTDPETGREYALSGQYDQTAIVDITDGILVPVAVIPRGSSTWSDIKVYKNYMYVGTESSRTSEYGPGIQVFDLTRIRHIDSFNGIQTFKPDSIYYEKIRQSHNVVINEETGYLYVVGSRSTCSGGLHIVDIREPSKPKFAGCFSEDGYTHDAQCFIYKGPDKRYQNREICLAFNEDTLTIVDVHDKDNIKMISRSPYSGSQYTHQGWATEDHRYVLLNDELDESRGRDKHTHTYIWDIIDLENPTRYTDFLSSEEAIDHNLYIKGDLAFLTNYEAGLRVLNVANIASKEINEIAYFDVDPSKPSPGYVRFRGSWSSYPYFKSGLICINSIERGLFVVKFQ